MYRTSTQEPQYKHSLYEREPRHVESKEFSDENTSSSEEEEESSGKFTEESDEETTESHESHSLQKRSDWSPAFEQQWSYNKLGNFEKNITNPYICDTRIYKQDKVTQKNLLSPFPSFLIPPIPRQVTGPTQYRLPNVRSPKVEQNNLKNSTKYSQKKSRNYKDEESMTCLLHKNRDCKERKVSQKAKMQKDQLNQSKDSSSDRVLKCLHQESPEESARNFSKSTGEAEGFSKQLMSISKYIRRPKSSTRENTNNQQTMTKFADGTLEHESRGKSRPKTAMGIIPCENDTDIREAFLARNIGDGKLTNKKGGEMKEKLVYVVEEEGKEVTKLETDLFTLNEILAIKRDLLELSEFAKKLKKLKEMKKESENTKNKENTCQCKPAEELLKDVNKRIEILEARQEELEKGNSRAGQKGDTETESKNTNITKMSSGCQSKTPAMINSSASTTIPSLPKTEVFVTRPEGFSTDIVKELMDIKTHLQRLEKRRISKEVSNEVVPEGSTKLTANKNHAIAVFSSKTYIFTTENFEKKKIGEKMKKEEKGKNYVTSIEENTRSEQRKANVASWLKNVKIEQMEADVSMFLSTERLKRKKNDQEEPKGNANVKCRNCFQALKVKDFENQEPQKNRALESGERKSDNSYVKLFERKSSISKINRYVGYKKCMMTPSGELFALMSESNEKVLRIPSVSCYLKPPPGANSQRLPSRAICRSNSSGSITSAILAKQQVRKLKAQTRANKRWQDLTLCPSRSKSMQELSLNSNIYKIEKIARNANTKKFGKTETSPLPKDRKNKESKNEFVKHLEAHLIALKKNFEKSDPTSSSCTYSEFLASINLDSVETSATVKSNTLQKNFANNEMYTYMASTKTNLKALDPHGQQEESCKESKKKKEKKQKQQKKEKKEKKKSELKKKSKPKKEKKCKEPTKQKKCKKKENKKEHRCECKDPDCSHFWKSYHRDNYFNYNEIKPTPNSPKIPSEDNLEIYRKRQEKRSKTNLECKKPAVDSFTIRNIFKNLGRYYPKISNFHLFPFSRGEFFDRKQEDCTKSEQSVTKITNKFEKQEDGDDYDDEDNEDEEDCNLTSDGSYVCQSLYSDKYSDQGNDHYHQATELDHLKNCRCVQVYLQTEEQQGWPGLRPFRALSVESMTNESTSKTSESCKSKKSESLFPEKKSQVQYVGHSTHMCEKKRLRCEKKLKKAKKRKQKCYKVCVCCKCGNIHDFCKKKRKKSKCERKCSKKAKLVCHECSVSNLRNCSRNKKPPNETFPLFSFFTNFCKDKSREFKFPKRIANKISEVRSLKACPRVKTNFFSKFRCNLPTSEDRKSHSHSHSQSQHNSCQCALRLQDIEKKLKKLEKKKLKCCCKKGKGKKKKEKKKERKKRREKQRKKKECCCMDSSESESSCHSVRCICCEYEEKRHKKKKKKNHKKHRTKCWCSECKKCDQKCSEAYYYTIESFSPNKTPEASTHKTGSSKTTEEEEEKDKEKMEKKFPRVPNSEELLEQPGTRLKDKLSSLESFWVNVQNFKLAKSQSELENLTKINNLKPAALFESKMAFHGDCRNSASKKRKSKVREMKEDPMTFLKKIIKLKKQEKETKEKRKKEKKTLKSKLKNKTQK